MRIRIWGTALLMVCFLTSCAIRPSDDTKNTAAAQTTEEPQEMETTAAEETTAPREDVVRTLSFLGCGDNIIYYGTYRDAASQAIPGGRTYNFAPIYDNVRDIISAADVAFINQETPVSQSYPPNSYPDFNSPVDLTYDVMDAGFDIINLANNHMLDKGALGLKESYENWKARGATVIGCYEEQESGKYITYYEKNDIRIAFLSYTYGTNLNSDPAEYGLYASYLKYADLEGEITEARENADFVIVSVHWGQEGSLAPNAEQQSYAQKMADWGADVILGHHPHVLQPIEEIQRQNGGTTLCVYSLGNFVHEQAQYINVVGGMITFDITKTNDARATWSNVQFTPTVCHYPGNFYGNKVYLLKDYTETLANQHAVRTYYNNAISLSALQELVTNTIDSKYLTAYLQ